MLLTSCFRAASPVFFISGFLSGVATFAPATAFPYDQLEQSCKPKFEGSHDCLESVPVYSYHLAVSSNYSGELCLDLGDWDGENKLVVEWDGLQTKLQLAGEIGVNHLLQPEQRKGRSSALVLYSDFPLMPELVEQDCSKGPSRHDSTEAVTAVVWPEAGVVEQVAVDQVAERLNGQEAELSLGLR